MTLDVTHESQVDECIAKIAETYGRIDVLVSNAGNQLVAPLEQLSFSGWRSLLAIHLDGAFLMTRAVLPLMYKQRAGSIIYMGSVHSKEASVLKAPYVTAKRGLIGLAKVVAKEDRTVSARMSSALDSFAPHWWSDRSRSRHRRSE